MTMTVTLGLIIVSLTIPEVQVLIHITAHRTRTVPGTVPGSFLPTRTSRQGSTPNDFGFLVCYQPSLEVVSTMTLAATAFG